MPPTIGGVTIDPQGQTLTVSITPAAKVYTDQSGMTPASFPATVTTRTSYYVSAAQQFAISVKNAQGTEIADHYGNPLVLDIQQGVMEGIAPILDRPGPEEGSQTGTYALAPASFDLLTLPVYQAHRLGLQVAPENTIEAARAMVAGGMKVLNFDTYLGRDGSLIVMHDTTIDRTTSGSGNTADQSAMSAQTLVVDAGSWFLPSWPSLKVPTVEQILAEFGGRVCFEIEAKNVGSGAAIAAIVNRLGLTKSVQVSSFLQSEVTAAKAAGLRTAFIVATDGSTLAATAVAVGANWIDVPFGSVTKTYVSGVVAAAHAAGQKVQVGPINNQTDAATYIGLGAAGVTSDDPLYVSGILPATIVNDNFNAATWWSGAKGVASFGAFLGPTGFKRHGWSAESSSNAMRVPFIQHGDFHGFLAAHPTAWTFASNVTFDALGSDTARHSDWAVLNSDLNFDGGNLVAIDTTGNTNDGFYGFIRANGQMTVNKIVNGVVTALASAIATAAVQVLTLSADLTGGAAVTSLPVTALTAAVQVGNKFLLPTGQIATASATAIVGATAVTVTSITPSSTVVSGSTLPQQVSIQVIFTGTTIEMKRTDSTGWTTTAKTVGAVLTPTYFHRGQMASTGGGANTGMQTSWSSLALTSP